MNQIGSALTGNARKVGEVDMKKDFIVRRSITMVEGKPHVETYSEQELIRCKDCLYGSDFDIDIHPYVGYQCEKGYGSHTGDWFCGDGKRK